jgi:DNA-binding MarR family transcriptional regulator
METSVLENELAALPGYLIRRLHQIHLALFAEECAGFDISMVEFGILLFIARRPGAEQIRISEAVGVDRGTLVNTVARLVTAGLLERITSRLDRRQKLLALTARGEALLAQMRDPVSRAQTRTLAALPPPQREIFSEMLTTLAETGTRTRLK